MCRIQNVYFFLGTACKNKWLNLRDQFRRVTKKRRAAEAQGIKRKKWRLEDEMLFLQPYFREKKIKTYHSFNETFDNAEIEEDEETVTFDQEDDEKVLTSDYVLGETSQTDDSKASDPIETFFLAMAATVKTFPPMYQHIAKNRVFNAISGIEIDILQGEQQESAKIDTTDHVLKSEDLF